MNVLSLFDGMSCGQVALNRAEIKIDNYFASEIDKHAIAIAKKNYPNTIHVGSVIDVDGYKLPKIDLLIGGSPCQNFSFAGTKKGMSTKDEIEILTIEEYLNFKNQGYEFEGQSYLFWEFIRLLNETKPKFFLLENVIMVEKWEKIINKALNIMPIEINSNLVSAQNRRRLYWTNIGLKEAGLFGFLESTIDLPKNKNILLKDILETNVSEKYDTKFKIENVSLKHPLGCDFRTGEGIRIRENGKSGTLAARDRTDESCGQLVVQMNSSKESNKNQPFQQNRVYNINGNSPALCAKNNYFQHAILNENKIRRLTPIECERLQTLPDDYTKGVSEAQRYKMIGNGWTIDIIKHILINIK